MMGLERMSLVTFADVLEVNWIILYFIYGQVFFITGLVTGLQWRRRSALELARPLPWLAAFGVAHGLNEWGYIFVPLQALYLSDAVVQFMVISHLLLLAVSFFFLYQFGVELMLPQLPEQHWLRAVPAVTLVVWGMAVALEATLSPDPLSELVAIGDGWSRYMLAFPGAILAHLGLLRQARQMRGLGLQQIARYLTGAALAFSMYAIVGGLVVPTAPMFPGNLLNYALLDRTVHLPAPVFRSLCGLGIAFFVVRSLEVFQVEADRRIEEMEHSQLLTADRERIGRELHDGIIQNIYAAGLGLEEVQHLVLESPRLARQRVAEVMDALNKTIRDIRNYIFDLQAKEECQGLEKVLEELVQDLRLDTLLEVDLEVCGEPCCSLEAGSVAHFEQIAREALSNVVQHSGARRVTVSLEYLGDTTRLLVADDGRGLPAEAANNGGDPGYGLRNMQARAGLLGGELALESGPGLGLRVILTVPCDKDSGIVSKKEFPARELAHFAGR
jgi:signal transduction histidine kinase